MTPEEQLEALKEGMFEYLDSVRDSGIDAAPYVQEEFGLTKQEAESVLESWMLTYDERHPSGK